LYRRIVFPFEIELKTWQGSRMKDTNRILVVEDEALVALDIIERLKDMGYDALAGQAASGEEALRLIETLRPHLVLMDIRLKGPTNGIDTALEIRRRFHLPVIFLTAHSEEGVLDQAKTAEPYGYILKPFENWDLKSAIEIGLFKHRSEEEVRRLNLRLQQQSQFLETLMNAIPQPVFYKDMELRYLGCNAAFERLTGIPRDRLIGKTVSDLFPSELSDIYYAADLELLNSTGTQIYEGDLCAADGIQRRAVFHKAVFCNSDGKVGGIIGAVEDITERKQAEAKLRESEERFRELAENIREIFWVSDSERLLYISPAYGEVFGTSPEALYDNPASFLEFVHPDDRELVLQIYRAHRDSLAPIKTDIRIVPSDGVVKWIRARSFPILEDGRVVRTVGLAENVTGEKEAHAALKMLLRQRELDRTELEESLLDNVKHLVEPYLAKLESSRLEDDQRIYVQIVGSHLKEITSPFAHKLSTSFLGLTPTEMRVADLIRQSRTSKEIAEILLTSERAVLFHRQSIRRKLGIKNEKVNLQSHLAQLA
jgi:PAS domain S-box-containing protein